MRENYEELVGIDHMEAINAAGKALFFLGATHICNNFIIYGNLN